MTEVFIPKTYRGAPRYGQLRAELRHAGARRTLDICFSAVRVDGRDSRQQVVAAGTRPQASAARRATAAGEAVVGSGPDLEEASPERSVESTAGGAVPNRQQAREEASLRHGSRRARENPRSERSADDKSEQEQRQATPGGVGAAADSLEPELAQQQETPSSSGAGKPTVT